MASLVDTNVLVYRFDPRAPKKKETATALLREGILENSIRIPHQAIIEFVSVMLRPLSRTGFLLSVDEIRREAEELLNQTVVLYPNEEIVRLALRGSATYQLSWYDAHLWAYAEHYGLETIFSEDFQHGRRYGTVRCVNPFLA